MLNAGLYCTLRISYLAEVQNTDGFVGIDEVPHSD